MKKKGPEGMRGGGQRKERARGREGGGAEAVPEHGAMVGFGGGGFCERVRVYNNCFRLFVASPSFLCSSVFGHPCMWMCMWM